MQLHTRVMHRTLHQHYTSLCSATMYADNVALSTSGRCTLLLQLGSCWLPAHQPCSNRSISPVHWAHSSKPASGGQLLWAHAWTDRWIDEQRQMDKPNRCIARGMHSCGQCQYQQVCNRWWFLPWRLSSAAEKVPTFGFMTSPPKGPSSEAGVCPSVCRQSMPLVFKWYVLQQWSLNNTNREPDAKSRTCHPAWPHSHQK